jgi:hypothetical protein
MKLKWLFLFNVGGCITLKEERVEGYITKAFTLKEIVYFSSVYFAEEHNVNALTMRYNIDKEPPCSDLSILASNLQ